ncbi:Hint domain-containing protein [Aliiroseovarius sp. PrR006]|uniref:Hint domain-containing protein n=1 Tax=Aliiroseovarius sp. PrR006 TaxID=2706883 RepID=UPI0013D4A27E|nr:Hint domain-containing protein [Aliiroseovarius sp. PrR006]NDW53251.1 Hint domain-containing protein [Aliiroseovarius sp. PrR006]
MATYSTQGWIWSGFGTPITLQPVTIEDDDPFMSPYFTLDPSEEITIGGTTYGDIYGGTRELTFTDSNGVTHTEDFFWWASGTTNIFVPAPGSAFDDGSIIISDGGAKDITSGFAWTDVTCFTAGTLIETDRGSVAIEGIQEGDLVLTADGLQPVRWIGKSPVAPLQLLSNPKLFPIRIIAGALGAGLPKRDLLVSRQHRMLVQSPIAQRMFGTTDVLIHAIKLTQLPGIYVDQSVSTVTYYHMLFDEHQVVYAEGAPSESLYTGPEALKAISDDARDEVLALFPELADRDYAPEFATFAPDGKRQKKLVARHLKNGKPLLSHC